MGNLIIMRVGAGIPPRILIIAHDKKASYTTSIHNQMLCKPAVDTIIV